MFNAGEEAEALAKDNATSLTAWFELNPRDPEAHKYAYAEISYHYWFTTEKVEHNGIQINKKVWLERKREVDTIPRIYSVTPKDVERFHLRILLLNVKGAKSFEELKTFEGETYLTFREAAKARNLLKDDDEWQRLLQEAEGHLMPAQLREFFAYILAFNTPTDSLQLWNNFKTSMSYDYLKRTDLIPSELLSIERVKRV